MMSRIRSIVFPLALAAGLAVASSAAMAVPILKLESGSTVIEITDNLAGDLQPGVDGKIEFDGIVGAFYVTGTFGLSKPYLDGTDKILAIESIDVSTPIFTPGEQTLTLTLTDVDFTAPSGVVDLMSDIQGVTMGEISYQSYFDASNTAFGTGTQLASFGPLVGFVDESLLSTVDLGLLPYARTLVVSVTHFGQRLVEFSAFSANTALPVPEASSVALMIIGLIGLAFTTRRRLRIKSA